MLLWAYETEEEMLVVLKRAISHDCTTSSAMVHIRIQWSVFLPKLLPSLPVGCLHSTPSRRLGRTTAYVGLLLL